MFRLLRLNPPHGWRAVLWELGIVTAGVLIALGAQEWVTERSWEARVAEATDALREENKSNYVYGAEMIAVTPCLIAQLDLLADRVRHSGDRLSPAEPIDSMFGPIAYRRPTRPFSSTVWNSYVADGVANHFPRELRLHMASAANAMSTLRRQIDQSSDAVDATVIMLQPAAIDAQARIGLLKEISMERTRIFRVRLNAVQMMAPLHAAGQQPSDAFVDSEIKKSGTIQYCRSKGRPLDDWKPAAAKERDLGTTII